jgi:serine/threonine-protein kinase
MIDHPIRLHDAATRPIEKAMTDPLHARIRAALGAQYRIDDEIGRGGMSIVYRAQDLRLNRAVAIKVLPPELALDPAVRSRFRREAQTSAQLSHPHIVPIYDVGESDGMVYFVMALVTGGNLGSHLEQRPLRAVDEVRRVLAEVADALAYAHLRGVIHRDIKADNILLESEGGRCMVTDFGIARAMEGGARLTQTGIAVGTPTYMSPEQAVGDRHVDGRSDIYSLGVVGYQMLTGRVPFTAGNAMALLLKHVSERPEPILDLRPETPRGLAEAVERALAKSADARWPTAAAFREALLAGDGGPVWRSEPREPVRYVSPVPRSGRRDAQLAVRAPAETRLPAPNGGSTTTPIEMEASHLTALTPEQRTDLRLWNGRVNLLDRVKFARRYALLTGVMTVVGFGAIAGSADVPPLALSPLVPLYMSFKLWRRGQSLRQRGLRLRRVFFSRRSRWAFPAPASTATPSERELEKLATRVVLDGPFGELIRRAAGDRAAIAEIVGKMSKDDRALVPDIKPTADALVERVVGLARAVQNMESDVDTAQLAELNARIASLRGDSDTPEEERRVALLHHQRDTLDELARRRTAMVKQMESAALTLGNLRLDLIRLRSAGVGASIREVSSATQQARALSNEIDTFLAAAEELRNL